METMLLALASLGAAGLIAFMGGQLCVAQAKLDLVRSQRRRDRLG